MHSIIYQFLEISQVNLYSFSKNKHINFLFCNYEKYLILLKFLIIILKKNRFFLINFFFKKIILVV